MIPKYKCKKCGNVQTLSSSCEVCYTYTMIYIPPTECEYCKIPLKPDVKLNNMLRCPKCGALY